jgi:hypothetical protein
MRIIHIIPMSIEELQSNSSFKARDVEFKMYDKTTQIVSLPGGLKRDSDQIKDDTKPVVRSNVAFGVKMTKDYNSNIACLPCRLENQPMDRPVSTRNYQKSDIFHTGPVEPVNTFNKSYRRKDIRHCKESEIEKKLIPYGLPKPNQYKDPFKSQISLY